MVSAVSRGGPFRRIPHPTSLLHHQQGTTSGYACVYCMRRTVCGSCGYADGGSVLTTGQVQVRSKLAVALPPFLLRGFHQSRRTKRGLHEPNRVLHEVHRTGLDSKTTYCGSGVYYRA
uniref:Uncharacterized protein n=1 Tax=Cacopsylla melanoneura TaxID=428564 RepID=A0A8D8ZFL6_9HEMI